MAAYVVFAREKTRSAAQFDELKKMAVASFQKRRATFLAVHGCQEGREGPKNKNEDIVILEFPSYEAAQARGHSPEYQAAGEPRVRAGDYRCILTESASAK